MSVTKLDFSFSVDNNFTSCADLKKAGAIVLTLNPLWSYVQQLIDHVFWLPNYIYLRILSDIIFEHDQMHRHQQVFLLRLLSPS